MSERQIDDAIDEAVRDLMNVDADPAFRAHVVERLRQPKPRSGFWRQLSVAAAALVVVIVVALMRGGPRPAIDAQPTPIASVDVPRQATTPRPPAIERSNPVVSGPPLRAARRSSGEATHQIERGSLVATVADVPLNPTNDGDALALADAINSIALEPLSPTPIVTPAMAIAPIAPLSEIVIAPLDPRRERD